MILLKENQVVVNAKDGMISAVWCSYRLFKQVFVHCRFLKSKISECVCTPSKFLCFFWFRRLEFTIQDCLKAIEAFLTNCDYLLISTFGLWNTFDLKYTRICVIMHIGYFLTINGKITLSEYFLFRPDKPILAFQPWNVHLKRLEITFQTHLYWDGL